MRSDLRSASEPTRLLLGDLRAGLAREQALAQRFTVAPESVYWTLYHRAAARDDSALDRIGTAMHDLGPDAQKAFDTLNTTVSRWREVAAIQGRRSPELLLEQMIHRGVTYEDLLRPTLHVDSVVSTAMQMRRERIEAFDALALRLTIVFAIVGCVAALAVLVLTLRGRHLSRMLRRRAEEETTLRALARALSGAVAVPDVASLTVNAAIQLSRVGGAYLAATHDGRFAVLAAGGSCLSKSGKSLVVPRWLNDPRRRQPRMLTCETPPHHDEQRGRRHRAISSELIVPMHHDGSIIGLLALRSAGGRRALSHSTARYGRALGDLAAVAMHRAQALEREREARLQAEGAVQTRDRVVSIVSHDLRNPLTAILGGAELLLDVIPSDADREPERDQLQRMRQAAITMNRLIADLLDITRLESGPLPMHSAETNLVDVIDNALDLFQSAAHQREITLERPAAGGLPTVLGDPERLAQMLSNLLGNALKFTPRGGRVGISVAVGKDNRDIELVVRDTGPGIPPERLEHLFDRFWQVTNDHRGGLGLGLSIVRAIADAHGAEIHVESTPKRGTTVRIALPTKAAREEQTPSTSKPTPAKIR